jgi:hypothetical protein
MNVVISQPFFLPWIGLFEQLRLADIFVHFDNVQMPGKNNFVKRVQIKTQHGIKWLTVPVQHINGKSQIIDEVKISYQTDWKNEHQFYIENAYKNAAYFTDVKNLIKKIYEPCFEMLSDYLIYGIETLAAYFGFMPQFVRSSTLSITSKKSQRVLDIVKYFNGDRYISGHGALNYADHNSFDENNISFEYIDYRKKSYSQLYGDFTPYVSIIDLIANCGRDGVSYICSDSLYWKDYIKKHPTGC